MNSDAALWSDLQRRYDGPIPHEDFERVRWGLDLPDAVERAAGRRLMWASQTRRHIRRIRKARQLAGAKSHIRALERELRSLLLYFRGANRDYWQLLRLRPDA